VNIKINYNYVIEVFMTMKIEV